MSVFCMPGLPLTSPAVPDKLVNKFSQEPARHFSLRPRDCDCAASRTQQLVAAKGEHKGFKRHPIGTQQQQTTHTGGTQVGRRPRRMQKLRRGHCSHVYTHSLPQQKRYREPGFIAENLNTHSASETAYERAKTQTHTSGSRIQDDIDTNKTAADSAKTVCTQQRQ